MPFSNEVLSLQTSAINNFNSGLNCAQSVLSVFSDTLGIDNYTAQNISSGFGAGMGRLQKTCGSVTGAFMVLSFYSSQKNSDIQQAKEEVILKIKEFNERFLEMQDSTDCLTLLNCDLNTEAGQEEFQYKNLRESVCESCIRNSVQVLSELIN